MRDMGNHRVLFAFAEESNVNKVLMGEPWSFDKYPVALKRVERSSEVKNLVFDRTNFWVQVHDLPIGSLNMRMARDIVSTAREVMESEVSSEECEGGNFMRVRVNIDVTKPLCIGRKVVWQIREEN